MFKSLFLGLALLMSVSTATATEAIFTAEQCKSVEGFAKGAMNLRQLGGSISDMMALVEADTDGIDSSTIQAEIKLMKAIVLSAFEFPREDTEAGRARAVEDFAEIWGSACWKRVKS